MSDVKQEERKRFFNDDLDTSETSLNFKSENKESFLFSNSHNDDDILSVSDNSEGEKDTSILPVNEEIREDDQDQFIGELLRIIPEMPTSISIKLNEKFGSKKEGLLSLIHI